MTDATLAPSIKTPLSERLGLRYPFVCAPMFIISNVEMLIACAEAGILGVLPSLNARTHEELRAMLTELKERCPGPYAINLTLGLSDPKRMKADLEACFELEVPVLVTSYGDPTEVVREARERGVMVMHDVVHLKHALKAERAGVDAVIGVGAGAGGHAGQVSPFVLIPWLKEALEVPVVAAGGISTGDQALAALSLGAELCYMGTRFIASTECAASEEYKRLVVEATPDEVVYTDEVSGVHANFLRSTLPQQGEGEGGQHKKWRDVWSAGQGVAQVREVKPIHEIVQELAWGYHERLKALNS